MVRAPGVSSISVGDLVDHRGVETCEGGHALTQRFGEVDLAAHRGLGDCADLVLHAGVRGEHLDDFALIRVESTSNTMSRLARRASPARSTAMSTPLRDRDLGQAGAQRASPRRRCRRR